MKRVMWILAAFAATLFSSPINAAIAATRFSALAADSESQVYAGVKERPDGGEIFSYLMVVNTRTFKSSRIRLPKEIQDREIVAVFPSSRFVYVLTQLTLETGDNPVLHGFNTATRSWEKIDEVACPRFSGVRVEASRAVFQCEEDTEAGQSKILEKTLELGTARLGVTGEVKLPQEKASVGKMRASLEGDPFDWKRLRIRVNGREKVISAGLFEKK